MALGGSLVRGSSLRVSSSTPFAPTRRASWTATGSGAPVPYQVGGANPHGRLDVDRCASTVFMAAKL